MVTHDVLLAKNLIVTGDIEGLIKIWNGKKELMREIKFNEPISAVCFMNAEGDILVGHGGQLSKIDFKEYSPGKTLIVSDKEHADFKLEKAFAIHDSFFQEVKERGFDIVKGRLKHGLSAVLADARKRKRELS